MNERNVKNKFQLIVGSKRKREWIKDVINKGKEKR